MDLGLEDKVAIITGGASGLGRATAELMSAEGMRVLIADYNGELLSQTVKELTSGGARALAVQTDTRSYADCQRMVAAAIEAFGQVDALVNSAGVGGPVEFFADTDPEQWDTVVDINLRGVMNCCRAVTDHMRERRYGKIVSLGSEAGKVNEKRMVVYGATKGGVIALTKGLATELGRFNINVNSVCPGVTLTPMTAYITEEMQQIATRFYPMGRLGRPMDIAPMITFLCSDATSWITGQAISVGGGFTRC